VADPENIYSAITEQAARIGLHRPAPPPDVPSERDFARVSGRRPLAVTCAWTDLGTPATECHAQVAALDKHGQLADPLHPERGTVWGPWRLTLDRAYQQDKDGHWAERPRVAHRRELGREELGRKTPAAVRWMRDRHLASDDERIPTLPTWLRCRACGHWRRLDADRLGVGHPHNLGHT
jgi:hypothetical protein